MPVKILLADKSITIQKVVEMLFSGKEYEVTCVSDGDSAFSEASRVVPDVVLADVDLPRIDGYTFAGRLRETPALAKVPVILMLSRDDVYDAMKGKLAGLSDNIAKPFESQELIGKVKKALLAAPPAVPASKPAAEAVVPPKPVAPPASPLKPVVAPPPPPKPVAAPPPPLPAVKPMAPPKPVAAPPSPAAVPSPSARIQEAVPMDIFDIIDEAPADASVQQAPKPQSPAPEAAVKAAASDEETFEVEPEYDVEPELEPAPEMPEEKGPQDAEDAFDTDKLFGREPMPAGGALSATAQTAGEAAAPPRATESLPTFDFSEPLPAEAEEALPLGQRAVDEMRQGLGLGDDAGSAADMHPDIVSFESLDMASRASHEDYTFAPPEPEFAPPPVEPAYNAAAAPAGEPRIAAPLRAPDASVEMLQGVTQEALEKAMREVVERVAWEVIPDLAERLIREEIERLKAETK